VVAVVSCARSRGLRKGVSRWRGLSMGKSDRRLISDSNRTTGSIHARNGYGTLRQV
jgi:hypothetical protein